MNHNFTLKEWESDFFNQTIFDFNFVGDLHAINSWPEKSLITAKVNASDFSNLNTVNQYGFDLCEGELVFQKSITSLKHLNGNVEFSNFLADENDIEDLKLIVTDLYTNRDRKSVV